MSSPHSSRQSLHEGGSADLGRLLRAVATDTRSVLFLARACADRLEAPHGDEVFRTGLYDLLREATTRVDDSLERLQRLAAVEPPEPEPVDVVSLLSGLLDRRWADLMERDVLLLKELERPIPPLRTDRRPLQRALDAVLSLVVCAVARGGDVHVAASASVPRAPGERPGVRVLLHFPVDRGIWDVERLAETAAAERLLRRIGGELCLRVTADRIATAVVALSSSGHHD